MYPRPSARSWVQGPDLSRGPGLNFAVGLFGHGGHGLSFGSMNPRQRRAVLLLTLAVAGLLGVFVLVANYVSDVETQVGDKIVVLELSKPAKANEAIDDDMVTERT